MPWVLTPPLAYMIEAQRIKREMAAKGVVLTPDQARELAHARLGPERKWVAQEPVLSEEGHRILDRIVAGRAGWSVSGADDADDPDPDTRRKPGLSPRSDIRDQSAASGGERGQPDTATRAVQENPGDKDPITEYLENVPDLDDGEWTPS